MAMGLFQSIDWLTKKVKKLCCWLGIIEEYTGANLPYVEFHYDRGSLAIPTTLVDYNTGVFQIVGGASPCDFSSFTGYTFGNTVIHRVYGSAGNLQLTNYFNNTGTVYEINDPFGLIKEINANALITNPLLQKVYLPNVSAIGDSAFEGTALTTIYIPKCTQLGSSVGNDLVFNNVTGLYITLKVDPSRLTCNAGGPDGDIAYLQANNIVVIN